MRACGQRCAVRSSAGKNMARIGGEGAWCARGAKDGVSSICRVPATSPYAHMQCVAVRERAHQITMRERTEVRDARKMKECVARYAPRHGAMLDSSDRCECARRKDADAKKCYVRRCRYERAVSAIANIRGTRVLRHIELADGSQMSRHILRGVVYVLISLLTSIHAVDILSFFFTARQRDRCHGASFRRVAFSCLRFFNHQTRLNSTQKE